MKGEINTPIRTQNLQNPKRTQQVGVKSAELE